MSIYKEIFTSTGTGLKYSVEPVQPISNKSKTLCITDIDETTGLIAITLGRAPKVIDDVNVLLDKVTLALLTTLGTSAFNPELGGYLTIGRTQSNADLLKVQAQISATLQVIQTNLIIAQNEQLLDNTQRLKELRLSDVYINPSDQTTLLIEVLVITEANEEYIITA
jgi:hypothetical protein